MNSNEQSRNHMRHDYEARIPLESGIQKISEYRCFIDQYQYPDNVSKTLACHITRTDLEEMLSEGDIDGIRCYFGFREIKEEGGMQGQTVTCLVMVGTRLLNNGVYSDVIVTADGKSGVYEFTTPCPDTCDTNSPLYNANCREGEK